ncbi:MULTISPECIES: hypothetical protein [unclassified Streptomyces]|uniref:hypothetical protein n=1 Tax=unclassified Streptomyces TaxID=2593676 RepID=UPI0035DC478C
MDGQWEYQFATLNAGASAWDEQVNSMLAEWGAQGWEPVNHTVTADREGFPMYFYFLFRHRVA